MKTILVTNDDGIYGPGLNPLVRELKKFAKVIVVIPDQERSGTSHSLTLHKPIRIQKVAPDTYLVNGTPADCTRYGALKLVPGGADAVISGINSGPNFGNDVNYSGTVAGAREGCMLGNTVHSCLGGRTDKRKLQYSGKNIGKNGQEHTGTASPAKDIPQCEHP